mgnify:CR=1 FL=1
MVYFSVVIQNASYRLGGHEKMNEKDTGKKSKGKATGTDFDYLASTRSFSDKFQLKISMFSCICTVDPALGMTMIPC